MKMSVFFFPLAPIAASIVAATLIGILWYSPLLFGKIWVKLTFPHYTKKDIENMSASTAVYAATLMSHAVTMTVLTNLANAFAPITAISQGVLIGAALSAMIFSTQLPHALFNQRPALVYLIDHCYDTACVITGCIIIALYNSW